VQVSFSFQTELLLLIFPRIEEPWIGVMAVLVLVIALFYLGYAFYNLPVIYWTTVHGRFFVLLSFPALLNTKKAKPMLLMFVVIDALGAVCTLITLL
jgi:hypothetical protein